VSEAMPALGANQQFCRSCGKIISNIAPSCPHCGAPTGIRRQRGTSPKSRLAALLLCLFLGLLGAHRFYVGKIGTAVLQIFTLGGLGIWWLIDLLTILMGSFTDSEGEPVDIWLE